MLLNANDNVKGKMFPKAKDVVDLDSRRPKIEATCQCFICGRKDKYRWPITWLLGDVQCRYCGSYGGLGEW